jgi:membrane fusion protein (multidrug efflux system)
VEKTLPVVGTLAAKSEAVVSARVEGQVEQTLVDFGACVKKAQELARIDTASYEALANQAAANVAKARASATNAAQNLKRISELQASRISSASEFDGAEAQAAQSRADLKAVEAAEAIARLNLERSLVTAPFDGSVAERIATAGDYVKAGSPLYRLVDDTELKYIVQVPERYAGQVTRDQVVRFSVDAWPGETFLGKVYLISPAVSVSTRAFNVGALVANQNRKLKANTFARGELVIQGAVPTPLIPYEAVVNFAGVTKVYVIVEGTARSRQVRVGRILGGQQEVLEGLQPGEVVAVTGQTKLYDGVKVKIQSAESPPVRSARSS